jgi:hypothetical protein
MFVCESSNEILWCNHFVTCPEEGGSNWAAARSISTALTSTAPTVASNALTDMVNLTRADLGRIAEGYFVIDDAPMAIST